MLEVRLVKQLGQRRIDLAFSAPGAVTALFGPSGAGKTSILSMIAGLIRPDEGRVRIDDEVLFDKDAGIDLPPHKRVIGYVFQDGRLLPHLSVGANLDYGRRSRGLPADPDHQLRTVEMLDIGPLLSRRIGTLSGGERQRVAIGRALISRPRLLLLDEPLASLDERLKGEILPYLLRLKGEAGLPMIYVSHDRGEVDLLADTVIEIRDGCLV